MGRLIDADKLGKLIAGHSNYSGDKILSVIYCMAEGKEIDHSITPLDEERPTGEWIAVSERLPEEKDSLFKNKFFDKTSDTVLVTVADRKGQTTTTYAHTIDGKWSCALLRACSDYKIIAWQPLPEPYKGGEEQ